MSSELLAGIAGIVLSLLFEYFPGLNAWYNDLVDPKQKLIMLAALFVSALGVFGMACVGKYDLVTCDVNGAWLLAEYFVLATIANQATHRISP